jgi:hypothetical protein
MKLRRLFKKFLDLFSSPNRKNCPYCRGGKCLAACQMAGKGK